MQICGEKISLRRAEPADAQRAYEWLALSDLTAALFGPPLFADRTVPAPETFLSIYPAHLFDGSQPFAGRGYVISHAGRDLGFVCHGPINLLADVTELDIWLASREVCGQGYGSEALALLCPWLQRSFGINRFALRPSRRNVRALRAFRRAGFRSTSETTRVMRRAPGRPILLLHDAVTMALELPPPRPVLQREPGRSYVFLDSEFTDFDQPQLISVAGASTDATAFYCEISDWERDRASAFVKETVLPLLDGDAVPLRHAAGALAEWLGQRAAQAPVTIVTDSGFDRWALTALFGEDLPPRVCWQCVPLPYQVLDHVVAQMGLRRHHALDDARALRHALVHRNAAMAEQAARTRLADNSQATDD